MSVCNDISLGKKRQPRRPSRAEPKREAVVVMAARDRGNSAKRRRERRQTVAMELASALHLSRARSGPLNHNNTQVRQAAESSGELRLATLRWTTLPLRLRSPYSARTSRNLLTTWASKETQWTTRCWSGLTPNSA